MSKHPPARKSCSHDVTTNDIPSGNTSSITYLQNISYPAITFSQTSITDSDKTEKTLSEILEKSAEQLLNYKNTNIKCSQCRKLVEIESKKTLQNKKYEFVWSCDACKVYGDFVLKTDESDLSRWLDSIHISGVADNHHYDGNIGNFVEESTTCNSSGQGRRVSNAADLPTLQRKFSDKTISKLKDKRMAFVRRQSLPATAFAKMQAAYHQNAQSHVMALMEEVSDVVHQANNNSNLTSRKNSLKNSMGSTGTANKVNYSKSLRVSGKPCARVSSNRSERNYKGFVGQTSTENSIKTGSESMFSQNSEGQSDISENQKWGPEDDEDYYGLPYN